MGDLTECVHPGIRTPGHHEVRGRSVPGEDGGEPRLELTLHGAESRLRRPTREGGAVVGDVEPIANEFRRRHGDRLPLLLPGLLVRYHAAESRRGRSADRSTP